MNEKQPGRQLQTIDLESLHRAIAGITNPKDARKLVILADSIVNTAKKLYRASEIVSDVKEDRDRAYRIALEAGTIRLLAEAKLGQLLAREIRHKGGRPKNTDTGGRVLKELGLTHQDSHRAQVIARYRHLIPKVVIQAEEKRDIPTRKGLEREIKRQTKSGGV